MDGELSHHLALTETSSVVAHDLCAQLHVMRFCIEELMSESKIPKHLYEEYLSQLNSSTDYMDRLLFTYRSLLKLEKEQGDSFTLPCLLNYAQHLTQGHYQSLAAQIFFDDRYDDVQVSYQGSYRHYSHIVFAIYSCFIEWEHDRCERKEFNFEHTLFDARKGGSVLSISLPEAMMSRENLTEMMSSRTRLKGRLRQWFGLNHLNDRVKEDPQFIEVIVDAQKTSVRIKLP